MAFVKVQKGIRKDTPGASDVRMGTHRNATGRTVYLSVGSDIIEQVGWEISIVEATRGEVENRKQRRIVAVAINEGVGEDKGYWLLTEDKQRGYSLGQDHKGEHGAFMCNVLASRLQHYVLNDDNVPVEQVLFEPKPDEKALLVQMPDWLRYNPQSYKEPDKPKLELTAPKEDKKPRHPTLSVVESDAEITLNRRQRRLAAQVLTRAMR